MQQGSEHIVLKGGTRIRRIVTGLWQMADQQRDGRAFDLDAAAQALVDYAREGFDTFDMADHYGSAEIVAGIAHKALREAGETPPTILTKWCPPPGEMSLSVTRKGVETALDRLALDRIDVMQFHWWRYESPEYLDALTHLMTLRDEGLIGEIGLTNFDAAHLRLVLHHGIDIASNQVCFSLLDRRAAGELSELARASGVKLLAFGTLCGGFLSQRWVGAAEPVETTDWSGMKYRRFIQAAGGWEAYQSLLSVLAQIAKKHDASVSNIAARWVLDHEAVGGVIIGVRLGEREHRVDNLRLSDLSLDAQDNERIATATARLMPIPGDCGDEYRKPPFLTASGDLSDHLDALPPVFPVSPVPARPLRRRAHSRSVWEDAAGFSRAIRSGDRILVSGTTATDGHGDCVCPGDLEGQAVYILDKIIAAVTSLGGAAEDIVRTRIYLRDTQQWEVVSKVHKRYFNSIVPANTLIGVDSLVGPYEIEIEAEAMVKHETF